MLLALAVLLLPAACRDAQRASAPTVVGSTGAETTVSGSAGGPGPAPAASVPPSGGQTSRGPKVLNYENVTLFVPETWRLVVRGGVAGLGDFAPRPGGRPPRPSLSVSTSSPGPIDEAAPKRCEEGPAASVDVVEAGFAPIGERTAEFRLWIATCEDGTSEEKRAWLLPASKVFFVEEYHVPENVDVVTTAQVG